MLGWSRMLYCRNILSSDLWLCCNITSYSHEWTVATWWYVYIYKLVLGVLFWLHVQWLPAGLSVSALVFSSVHSETILFLVTLLCCLWDCKNVFQFLWWLSVQSWLWCTMEYLKIVQYAPYTYFPLQHYFWLGKTNLATVFIKFNFPNSNTSIYSTLIANKWFYKIQLIHHRPPLVFKPL